MKALIILVSYKDLSLTTKLITSLKTNPNASQIIPIVAHNSAKNNEDTTFSDLCQTVNCPENLGYFGAAQKALEVYSSKNPIPDWVIISNTDIEIKDSLFWEKLFQISKQNNTNSIPGVIGPSIISSKTNQDQNPMMTQRPKASRMHFYKHIFSNELTCWLYQSMGSLKKRWKKQFAHKAQSQIAQNIYAPNGAFIIFHKSYFEKGGNFKHGAFLYGEEITVAETARKLGLKIRYEPQLQVFHVESESTNLLPKRHLLKFFAEASKFCADTYFSKG